NVSEGDGLAASTMTAIGQVTFSDVDTSDTHAFTVSSAAAHGSASVDASGNWTYKIGRASCRERLEVAELLAASFTEQGDDHHGGLATQAVRIHNTGTHHAPSTTSASQSRNVSEGDGLAASTMTAIGQVTFSDVDTSDTHAFTVSSAAAHGSASVDASGNWTY